MQFSSAGGRYTPVVPLGVPEQRRLDTEAAQPFFDPVSNTLKIPPAQQGRELTAFPVASSGAGLTRMEIEDIVRQVFISEMDLRTRSKTEDGNTAFLDTVVKHIRQEFKDKDRSEGKSFNNMWFELKPNTFSAAIWAILILDFDTVSWAALTEPANSKILPSAQTWEYDNSWSSAIAYPYYFWRKRFWPLLSALLFQVVSIFLCICTLGMQFGFSYLLYTSLDMPDFSAEGVEYICATTGWLQLISIGFFIAYMLGELPRLLKTQALILWAEYETSGERGEQGCKRLWIDTTDFDHINWKKHHSTSTGPSSSDRSPNREIDPTQYHIRSKWGLRVRRVLATLVNLADIAITGFVLYVGVMYIFWSGYKSQDPSWFEEEKYAPLDEKNGLPSSGFPWMSNTDGVEEVLIDASAVSAV